MEKYTALALAANPGDAELLMRHGGILMYMEDYDGAMKTFNEALSHATTDSLRS